MKIVIADDHKIMREGLKALIEKQPDMEVAAEAQDGLDGDKAGAQADAPGHHYGYRHARNERDRCDPPDHFGKQRNKDNCPSMHSDRRFVLEMLKAGASGYLLKTAHLKSL